MCGRYVLSQTGNLPSVFEISETRIPPRYNIAPTQQAPVVRLDSDDRRRLDNLRWGLVPPWAAKPGSGPPLINARSETVSRKPAFRDAFSSRRCLVPANGFYEWKKTPGGKQPHWIGLSDQSLFAFAGLWESYQQAGSELESFTIMTCDANNLVAEIHDRMPVILAQENFESWLDPGARSTDLHPLLTPFPAHLMKTFQVSRLVNSPRNDDARCIEPYDEVPPPLFRT